MAILVVLAIISAVAITLIVGALLGSFALETSRRASWDARIASAFSHPFSPNILPWLEGCTVCGGDQQDEIHR
jgi:hypothetical protein